MEPQRAAIDPAVRSFEAEIVAVNDGAVALSETYFYAESGGQPADRGTIDGRDVTGVYHADGQHWHDLANADGLAEGTRVDCVIDDAFRRYCMRAHTASHVLYGAARRRCDELGYGGFDIAPPAPEGSGTVRIDFRTDTEIDDELLVGLERLANEAVWEDRAVTWEQLPADEVRDRDDVAFNQQTEDGAFGEGTVRTVTVDGWDVAACGGTHVSKTGEIGPITVLERSNPGAGLTRVTFAVGPVGIKQRATEKRAVLDASSTLDTTVDSVPEAVDDVVGAAADAEQTVDELRAELCEQSLREAASSDTDAGPVVVAETASLLPSPLDEPGPNELEPAVRAVASDRGLAILIIESGERPFVVVGTDELDAGAIVEGITEAFGGGGGGSEAFAQAGGIDASAADIQQFVQTGGWSVSPGQ